jgi:5,10-methylene-tetrahydrofolate dehydrogenase/methenyl tetrahydrofolate cyclohydrolase
VAHSAHPPEVLAVAETLKECGFNLKGGRVVVVGSDGTAGLVKILVGYLFDQGCSVRLLRYSNISQETTPGKARRLKTVEESVETEDTVINPEGEAVVTWANHGGWLTKSRLSPGSVVVDLGYRFARGRVSGDCDFVSVSRTAKVITPVPGGVRNITHVMILQNLIRLIKRQQMESIDSLGRGLQRRFK